MVPGLRWVRRLLVLVVLLGGLFIGLNIVAERMAEDRIEVAAQRTFGLEDRPTVDVRGFPVLVHVVQGRLPQVAIDAERATVADLALTDLRVLLDEIAADGGLLGGGRLTLSVASAVVDARATQESVLALIRKQGIDVTSLRLVEGGARVGAFREIGGEVRRIDARARVSLSGRTLRIDPTSVTVEGRAPSGELRRRALRATTVRVRLPKLPGGFTVTRISVEPGRVLLRALAEDYELVVGG